LIQVSEKTSAADENLNKKESILQTTQDPNSIASLNKERGKDQEQSKYWQEREEFWWKETKMATPPKDSLEFKQTNDLREGIAKLEEQVGNSISKGNPTANLEKHKLDVVLSFFTNGNLEEAIKFLTMDPKETININPLNSDSSTVVDPEGQATITSGESSQYKKSSAETLKKLNLMTDPKAKNQLSKQLESQKELAAFFGTRSKAWSQEQYRSELSNNDPRKDKLDYIREYMVNSEARFENIASNPNQSKTDILNKNKINSNLNKISNLLKDPLKNSTSSIFRPGAKNKFSSRSGSLSLLSDAFSENWMIYSNFQGVHNSKQGMSNDPKILDGILKLIKNNPIF